MKKLLAMVLCVMMFASVLSTAAFADQATIIPPTDFPTRTNLPATEMLTVKAASDAISHAKANIEYMYGTLAANSAVFGTVKSMDDVINSMITNMFEGTTGYIAGLPVGTLKDNVKLFMKDVIGGSIINYLDEHFTDFAKFSASRKTADGLSLEYTGKTWVGGAGNLNYLYTDKNGTIYAFNDVTGNWRKTDATMAEVLAGEVRGDAWDQAEINITMDIDYDPIAYANTFAAAVSDAFNSKRGAANVEAIMYQLYSAKVLKDVNEKLDDLADDISAWENSSTLLDNYHFNEDLFVPYAFMNQYDTPETLIELPAVLWAP